MVWPAGRGRHLFINNIKEKNLSKQFGEVFLLYTLNNDNEQEWKMTEKKIRVVLVCAAGMSSSLIEEKIKHAAETAGKQMELKAVDSTRTAFGITTRTHGYHPGRASGAFKRSIIDKAEPLGIIVQDIDTIAYGMCDGEKSSRRCWTRSKKVSKYTRSQITASCRNAGKKF